MSTTEIVVLDVGEVAADPLLAELLIALERAGAITELGLDLSSGGEITYEQYEALGSLLGRWRRSSGWWIGDWINYGEGAWGERYAQALHETKLAEQTLLNMSYVCRQIPYERRLDGVDFSVHAVVAPLPPREQKAWLKKAKAGDWTVAELRARIKAKRTDQKPVTPPDPDGQPLPELVEEVARAILRDAIASPNDPGYWLVPTEDMARLKAALGAE